MRGVLATEPGLLQASGSCTPGSLTSGGTHPTPSR